MDLKISTRVAGDITVLEVAGEIELSNAVQLREALVHACNDEQLGLVVDLHRVTFIDSIGVGVLVGALKRARERNNAFVLACVQRRVRRIFEITGLLNVFPLSETVEDAIMLVTTENRRSSDSSSDGTGEE